MFTLSFFLDPKEEGKEKSMSRKEMRKMKKQVSHGVGVLFVRCYKANP